MPGLHLYQSLDMAALARRLADTLRVPHGEPFLKDIIVIDGKGTSNWLTHGIVREGGLGVQMNAELLTSRRFTPWMASVLRNESPKVFPFDPLNNLAAKLYAILSERPGEWSKWAGDATVDGGTVLWGLCFRLSNHYRELLRNDADWIGRAEHNASDRWSVLWREAITAIRDDFSVSRSSDDAKILHEADLLRVLEQPAALATIASRLPGRICLFATGDVARTHLKILSALRTVIDVHLFLLQPSREFLEDLQRYEVNADSEEDYPERSQSFRLLTACGRHYRLQQSKVLDEIQPDAEEFLEPAQIGADSLLGLIKKGTDDFEQPLPIVPAPDASLSIHRCHGAWREAEVVRDQLLAAFADPALKGLSQGEILILSPDPEIHAPFLAGVLSNRSPHFSFTTAGLYGLRKSPVGTLVKALLALPMGRITSLDVLNLLSLDVVRDHAGWADSHYETIEDWFREAPFLWGLNAGHRQAVVQTLPNTEGELESAEIDLETAHVGTLDDFIRRLSLGTAFGGRVQLIGKTLPLANVEGQQDLYLTSEVLRILRALKVWADFAQSEHTLAEWVCAFGEVTRELRPRSRELLEEYTELTGALAALERRARLLDEAPLSCALWSQIAEDQCDFEAGSGQFMSGSVTLAPLRATSIHPARVVILMGMNDGAFPRRTAQLGPEVFIDSNGKPTLARRSLEASEDTSMHTFLLALLAAKDRVIITFDGYVGSEGKEASAALPVEILRSVAERLVDAGKFRYQTHGLLGHHQPLAQGGLPTVGTRDEVARQVAVALGQDTCPVLAPPLPRSAKDISLAEWVRFWESPPRQALRLLGIFIPWPKTILATNEPLQSDSATSRLAANWVARSVKKKAATDWETARFTGFFPPTPDGPVLLSQLISEETKGTETLLNYLAEKALGITRDKLKESEVQLYKTDGFKIYVHGDNLAVAITKYFSEDDTPYRWLASLPAFAHELKRPIHRLFVAGLGEPTDKQIEDARESVLAGNPPKAFDPIPKCIFLEVPPAKIADLRSALIQLMDAATSATQPLMPRTLNSGLDSRFKDKPAKTNDDKLRGNSNAPGDASDPRARILVPEQYDFPTLNAFLDNLITDGVRRLTTQDVTKGLHFEPRSNVAGEEKPADKPKTSRKPRKGKEEASE